MTIADLPGRLVAEHALALATAWLAGRRASKWLVALKEAHA